MLLAAALRFHALARDIRFHPDEALFSTFARSAAVQGDWLLHGSLDKPPLTIYADALAMMFFGVTPLPNGVLTLDIHAGEFAARIPGTFASILLLAVMYALAKQVQGARYKAFDSALSTQHPALLVAFLAAVSPYALAFSATVFTDGLLLLMLTLALWAASRGKALQAGIWLALGFWCKQQAIFYVPLVLVIAASCQLPVTRLQLLGNRSQFFKIFLRSLVLVVLPLILGVVLLFIWDAAREQATSMWALAVANNDPGRLVRLDELLPRLATWWSYAQYLFGGSGISLLMLLAAGIGVIRKRSALNLILAAYVLLYFLFNWLIAFNIYDRYLLLLLPPLWLLAGQGVWEIFIRAQHVVSLHLISASVRSLPAGLVLCTFALTLFAVQASEGAFPIGGDHGENAGIDQLGAYLDSKPLGAIIYDHWLGWELGYYMGTWSDKRRVYYPSPQALAADALLQPDHAPRYLAAPVDAAFQPWLDALRLDGFEISLVYDQSRFVVYELIPPFWVGCASGVESFWRVRIEPFADSCA